MATMIFCFSEPNQPAAAEFIATKEAEIGEIETQLGNQHSQKDEDVESRQDEVHASERQLESQHDRMEQEDAFLQAESSNELKSILKSMADAIATSNAQIIALDRRLETVTRQRDEDGLSNELKSILETMATALAASNAQITSLEKRLEIITRERDEETMARTTQIDELKLLLSALTYQFNEVSEANAANQAQIAKLKMQLASLSRRNDDSNASNDTKLAKIGRGGRQTNSFTRIVSYTKFTQRVWNEYFGDVGKVPDLPADLEDILNRACPFWPSRTVRDTHLLVLIPACVQGRHFTLELLGKLIQRPRGNGHATKYLNYHQKVQKLLGLETIDHSYWVLLTRDILPGSRNKSISDQQSMVSNYADLGYGIPTVLEVATAILLHYVRSGERLFSDDPKTYTRCQEWVQNNPVVVGNFSTSGLRVTHGVIDHILVGHVQIGVSCCMKL